MSVLEDPTAFRKMVLGAGSASKSTGTLAATTVDLFIIAGGEVLITSLYGKVTTSITVANSYKLQVAPTTGATQDLCAATDIGTTDTITGTLLTFGLDTTTAPRKLMSIGYGVALGPAPVSIGKIQSVSAGTDGVITWYCTWVPLIAGATLVAA
jgi:hypothetical protein